MFRLPAILAAAEISLLPAASTARRSVPPLRWPSLIDHQSAAHQRSSIARLHRLLGKRIIIDLHKSKPARLSAEAISQDVNRIDLDASFVKERLQIGLGSLVG